MKQTKTKLALIAAILLCANTFAQETADTYDTEPQEKKELNKYQLSQVNTSVTTVLMGETPIDISEGSIFEYNALGTGLSQTEVKFQYYPKSDAIVITAQGFTKYYLFFDKNARAMIRSAQKQYLSDFEAHVLSQKSNKTYNAYGKFTGDFRRGLIGAGIRSNPSVSVGYKFVKKSPYFSLTYWPAKIKSLVPGADTEEEESSEKMSFFFTKRQLAAFVEALDESYIDSLKTIQIEKIQNSKIEADEY